SSRDVNNDELRIKIGDETVEEVKEFSYLGSKITEDGRSKVDIRSRLAQAKKAFLSKRNLMVSNMGLESRKKLLKTYIWSIALYGCETWTVGIP
ncbi:hypothetical protein, partial [Pantoea dispersa]